MIYNCTKNVEAWPPESCRQLSRRWCGVYDSSMAEFDGQTDEGAPVNGYSSDVSVETRSDNEPCDVNNSTRLTDQ